MASANIIQLLNKYLAKLNDPSKAGKYLNKISRMELSMDSLYQTDADLTVKKLIDHPTFGSLATEITNKWVEQAFDTTSPSSTNSSADESSTSIDSGPSRKRYIMMTEGATKKIKVDSDYEDTDDEEGRKYDERIDAAIKENIEKIAKGNAICNAPISSSTSLSKIEKKIKKRAPMMEMCKRKMGMK